MGVFDRFDSSEEKVPEAQVAYTGDDHPYIDFHEGFVTDNEDDLQRRLGNRQIQYVNFVKYLSAVSVILLPPTLPRTGLVGEEKVENSTSVSHIINTALFTPNSINFCYDPYCGTR